MIDDLHLEAEARQADDFAPKRPVRGIELETFQPRRTGPEACEQERPSRPGRESRPTHN